MQWKSDDLAFTLRLAELKATIAGRAQRSKPTDTMQIAVADLVSIKATDVGMTDLAVGPSRSNADGFTDGGISKGERFERELVAWTPAAGEKNMTGIEDNLGLLEDPTKKGSGKGDKGGWGAQNQNSAQWDQFAANKTMFGVDTSFDESQYTTQINKSGGEITEQEAARIAREIQNSVSTNVHMQEERGQRMTVDYDEEDLYGAVVGTGAAHGGAHSNDPTTKGGALLPNKPAWGSSKVPEGVMALADQERRTTSRSNSPPVPKPNPPAPKTDAGEKKVPAPSTANDADKPKSTLSATAKPFSLSAKATEFVPSFGKKPAAAPTAPKMMGAGGPGGFPNSYPGGMPMMMGGYPTYPQMPGFPPQMPGFPPRGSFPVGGRGGPSGRGPPHATAQQAAAMQQAAAAAAQYGMFQPGRPPAPAAAPPTNLNP